MTPLAGKVIWALGVVGWFLIRYPHDRRSRRTPRLTRRDRAREIVLMAISATGLLLLPLVYVFGDQPHFANYPVQAWQPWLGAVIFAAGHGADDDFDWAPLARTGQPIVLYMVMHNLERITAALLDAGLAGGTPTAVIVAATTPKQRVVVSTLEKLPADASAQNLEPPAIVVIGEIVKLRDALATTTAIPEESK